ncbi:MAG: hypothetical protein SFX74_05820 [Fimbriimonadaceae bacterium]|nr:hypothetical protein [Fimbriimonadaceae bacterium]
MRLVSLTVIGALLMAAISRAEETFPKVAAKVIPAAPTIDGKIGAEEWAGATPLEPFIDPVTGKAVPAANQTRAYIAYDNKAIYVAIIALDEMPNGIVGREIRPGSDFQGEDTLSFQINTFGTRSGSGYSEFAVNVLNTQNESISGGRSNKREWRGIWKSATSRNETGWSAEFAIPWEVLNYPNGKDLKMDFNVERFQFRTQTYSQYANTTVQERSDLAAQWLGVNPPPLNVERLQKLAYIAPEYDEGRVGIRGGVDLRYLFTPTLSGLVSVTPDFRNVEAQIAGIDFTRTERFLDEVRPFFTEGADYFRVGAGFGFGRMFYPLRLQQFDVGTKAFGRINRNTDVGALITNHTGKESAAVVRWHVDPGMRGDYSLYATQYRRAGQPADEAFGGSAFSMRGNYQFSLNGAIERDEGQPFTSAGDANVSYQVPNWFSTFRYVWVRPDFQPQLGFIPWVDRRGGYNYTEHFREFRQGPVRNYNVNFNANYFETYQGEKQQTGFNFGGGVTLRNDLSLYGNVDQSEFFGRKDRIVGFFISPNSSNRFKRFSLYHEFGKRADRPSRFTSIDASYRIGRRLDLGLSRSVNEYTSTDRLTIVTLNYDISATKSISGRFVSINGKNNGYLALRNGGGTGTEWFLILGDPNAQEFVSRVSLKVVFPF